MIIYLNSLSQECIPVCCPTAYDVYQWLGCHHEKPELRWRLLSVVSELSLLSLFRTNTPDAVHVNKRHRSGHKQTFHFSLLHHEWSSLTKAPASIPTGRQALAALISPSHAAEEPHIDTTERGKTYLTPRVKNNPAHVPPNAGVVSQTWLLYAYTHCRIKELGFRGKGGEREEKQRNISYGWA